MQTEFSVHRDAATSKLTLVSVDGFGATNVVAGTADDPHGPWSAPYLVARPAESKRSGLLVYSAKAHPYLAGGQLVISYSSNNMDFAASLADMSIYFPRFFA